MTDLKGPSGKVIRVGDDVTIKARVREVSAELLGGFWIDAIKGASRYACIDPAAVVSHTPALKPLKPGPALLDAQEPVTVLAVDGDMAWVRFGNGIRDGRFVSRLQNVEAG